MTLDCKCNDGPMFRCPKHSSLAQQAASKKSKTKGSPLARGKPLGKSDKGYELMAFERGVVAALLWAHKTNFGAMKKVTYTCRTCGRVLGGTLEEAMEAAPPSHMESRSSHPAGHGYTRKHYPDLGFSHPSNILPECVPCNLKREPQPEWGTA